MEEKGGERRSRKGELRGKGRRIGERREGGGRRKGRRGEEEGGEEERREMRKKRRIKRKEGGRALEEKHLTASNERETNIYRHQCIETL